MATSESDSLKSDSLKSDSGSDLFFLVIEHFQGAAKGGRQKEFDHFFFVFRDTFGHFLVTFSDAFVTFFVTFLPDSFCRTPLLVIEHLVHFDR